MIVLENRVLVPSLPTVRPEFRVRVAVLTTSARELKAVGVD